MVTIVKLLHPQTDEAIEQLINGMEEGGKWRFICAMDREGPGIRLFFRDKEDA